MSCSVRTSDNYVNTVSTIFTFLLLTRALLLLLFLPESKSKGRFRPASDFDMANALLKNSYIAHSLVDLTQHCSFRNFGLLDSHGYRIRFPNDNTDHELPSSFGLRALHCLWLTACVGHASAVCWDRKRSHLRTMHACIACFALLVFSMHRM